MSDDGNGGDEFGTPAGTPVTSTPLIQTVQIGNIVIEINDNQANVGDDEEVLYEKEDRASMAPKKLAELFEKATKNWHKKFDIINLTLSDENKLDDTYNLDMLSRKMKNAVLRERYFGHIAEV